MRVGDVIQIMYDDKFYRVDFINASRALVVPLSRAPRVIHTAKGDVTVATTTDGHGHNISADSLVRVVPLHELPPELQARCQQQSQQEEQEESAMPKRLCTKCGKTELHHDNKSGVCRDCKKVGTEAPVMSGHQLVKHLATSTKVPRTKKAAGKEPDKLELTDKEPKEPFVGLNLLVVEAIKRHRGAASVTDIAAYIDEKATESKQDARKAAQWHSWHLKRKGFLRVAR